MSVSIKKQFISFQNYFDVPSRLCNERVKGRFLIANTSTGNMWPASHRLSGPGLTF